MIACSPGTRAARSNVIARHVARSAMFTDLPAPRPAIAYTSAGGTVGAVVRAVCRWKHASSSSVSARASTAFQNTRQRAREGPLRPTASRNVR